MDYGNVAHHDYAQYLLTPEEYQTIFMLENQDRVTNSKFAGDIVDFWLRIFELASTSTIGNTLMSADAALSCHFSPSMRRAGGTSTTAQRGTNLRAVFHQWKKDQKWLR